MDRKEVREVAQEIQKERDCLNLKLKFLNKKQERLQDLCKHPHTKKDFRQARSGYSITCCDCGWTAVLEKAF